MSCNPEESETVPPACRRANDEGSCGIGSRWGQRGWRSGGMKEDGSGWRKKELYGTSCFSSNSAINRFIIQEVTKSA